MIHRARRDAGHCRAGRVAIEDVDRLPFDPLAGSRHVAFGPVPPDDRFALGRESIDEMAAGKACGAGDQDQRGTPLSAPLNGENAPRPASVNERKNRWSDGTGIVENAP